MPKGKPSEKTPPEDGEKQGETATGGESDNLESEVDDLAKQKEALIKQKRDLLKKEIEALQQGIKDLSNDNKKQESTDNLKPECRGGKDGNKAVTCSSNDKEQIPSLKEMKQLSELQAKVEEHMAGAQCSMFDESDTDSEEETTSNKRGKKKLKSGMNAKPSDTVKHPQVWPHCFLEFEYVNKPLSYKELEFRHFVAGELEIFTSKAMKECDARDRLEHLKQVVYWEGVYEWDSILDVHAAKLRLIEMGKKTWADDFTRLENQMLQGAHKSRFRPEGKDKV